MLKLNAPRPKDNQSNRGKYLFNTNLGQRNLYQTSTDVKQKQIERKFKDIYKLRGNKSSPIYGEGSVLLSRIEEHNHKCGVTKILIKHSLKTKNLFITTTTTIIIMQKKIQRKTLTLTRLLRMLNDQKP